MNSDELYRTLGRLIAEKRKRSKMTQLAFAKSLDLSRASIANIERGKQSVQLHVIFRMATILNVSVLELIPSSSVELGTHSIQVTDWLNRISTGQVKTSLLDSTSTISEAI